MPCGLGAPRCYTVPPNMTRERVQALRRSARWWKAFREGDGKQLLIARVGARSGILSRRLRYPNPLQAPYRRANVAVARESALGDVLMCMPALRRAKELNPGCRLSFYTKYPRLVSGLSFLDYVGDFGDRPDNVIEMTYERSIPPRRHIAAVLGDAIGTRVNNVRPACVVDSELVDGYREALHGYQRPWIVVNRFASGYTPNKEWATHYWDRLIASLLGRATIIEIGTSRAIAAAHVASKTVADVVGAAEGSYINLVGRTSLEQLVAVLSAGDIHVGPISGPVHIAAAVGTPSVVIYGGYEHPSATSYPGNVNLYSSLGCAPCWLNSPCPYNRECLVQISPQIVEHALMTLWQQGCP